MRRILVTGQGGQLAAALATALPPRGFEAITTGRPAFDFDAPASVGAAVATARPDAGGELRRLDRRRCRRGQ
jgi:dTDP-4-dehydrorhamnose reductase